MELRQRGCIQLMRSVGAALAGGAAEVSVATDGRISTEVNPECILESWYHANLAGALVPLETG